MINPSTVTLNQHSGDEEMQMTSHSMEKSVFNTLSHSEEDIRFSMMTQFTLLSDSYIRDQYTSQFLIQLSVRHAFTQIWCFITYLPLKNDVVLQSWTRSLQFTHFPSSSRFQLVFTKSPLHP